MTEREIFNRLNDNSRTLETVFVKKALAYALYKLGYPKPHIALAFGVPTPTAYWLISKAEQSIETRDAKFAEIYSDIAANNIELIPKYKETTTPMKNITVELFINKYLYLDEKPLWKKKY